MAYKLTPSTPPIASENNKNEPAVLSVVNVEQIKKPLKAKTLHPEDALWYNRLSTWLGIGLLLSTLCLIMYFFYKRFVYLIPFWPALAAITWYVRKKFRDFEDKNSGFFK